MPDEEVAKTDNDKLNKFDEWYKSAETAESKWRKVAEEDKAFYWSKQWEQQDLDKLNKQGRPALTYNEIKPVVNLVSGIERQNRYDLKAFSRTGASDMTSQIITILLKDIEDQSNASFEYSRQFVDGLITAKGYVEANVDYEHDYINGNITLERLDPFNVKIDPSSVKYDLSDAEFAFVDTWHTKSKLKLTYPNKAKEIGVMKLSNSDMQYNGTLVDLKGDYRQEQGTPADTKNDSKYKIKVKNCWYRTWEKQSFLFNETTGDMIQAEAEGEALEQWVMIQGIDRTDPMTGEVIPGTKYRIIPDIVKPILHYARYVGNVILQDIENPLGKLDRIPLVPFYAYFDGEECQGIITDLKDPQREINKRNSQFLHIINTCANGGVTAEEGSIDVEFWKANMGTPGFIGIYKKNTKEPTKNEPSGVPQAHLIAGQSGEDKIKKISGVNADLMGQPGRQEPGIVLQLRQKQGMIAIEQIFDNFRYTRKLIGQLLLEMIQKSRTYSDDEILALIGREKMEIDPNEIQKIINDVSIGRHDVTIDMTTNNTTNRIANFTYLVELFKAGVQLPASLLLEAVPDLPNRDEVLAKVEKAQQEQQQPGGGVPTQPPTPPVV